MDPDMLEIGNIDDKNVWEYPHRMAIYRTHMSLWVSTITCFICKRFIHKRLLEADACQSLYWSGDDGGAADHGTRCYGSEDRRGD